MAARRKKRSSESRSRKKSASGAARHKPAKGSSRADRIREDVKRVVDSTADSSRSDVYEGDNHRRAVPRIRHRSPRAFIARRMAEMDKQDASEAIQGDAGTQGPDPAQQKKKKRAKGKKQGGKSSE